VNTHFRGNHLLEGNMENNEAATQEIETETPAIETADVAEPQGSEDVSSDTGSAPEEDKVTFDERQQAKFDEVVGSKVAKQRAAEREAEELRRKLEEVSANIPQPERPTIPEIDPYSDTLEEDLKARDEAVHRQAEFDATQRANEQVQQQTLRQQQEQQVAQLQTIATTYAERAKILGVKPEELQVAADKLQQQGISDELTVHLLNDDKGPAITKYLADNPLALDAMRGMTSMQAAIHIETNVKPIAGASKKTTNAPPPSQLIEGGGTPPAQRGPKDTTYD
jgi:hypothetical protein